MSPSCASILRPAYLDTDPHVHGPSSLVSNISASTSRLGYGQRFRPFPHRTRVLTRRGPPETRTRRLLQKRSASVALG